MRYIIVLIIAFLAPLLFSQVAQKQIGGFNPTKVTAIKYWLDAGTITGTEGVAISTNWLDRSQNAFGALISTTNAVYRTNASNGNPAVEFDGTTSYCKSPSFSLPQPFTAFAVLKQLSWTASHRILDGGTANQAILNQSGATPKIALFAISAASPLDATTDLNHISLIEAQFNGASSKIYSNWNDASTGNPGTNGYTAGITLGAAGNLAAGFFANFQLLEFVLCDSSLSAYNRVLLRQYLSQKHKLATRSVVTADGNSLTSGFGAPAGYDYVSQLAAIIDGGTNYWRFNNFGVSGQTVSNMIADAASQIDPTQFSFRKRILLAWEITNSLVVDGLTDVQAEDSWLDYCTNRTAAGWKLLTFTVIPRTNFTAQMIAYKEAVNAWMRTNWPAFANGIVDLAADSRLSDFTNTNYYSADGIHLNANGYAVVAELVKPQVLLFK